MGDLVKTAAVVVAGLWVVYLYLQRREGQAVLRVGMSCRASPQQAAERALFVRVHVANVSAVVLRDVEAVLTLFRVGLHGDPMLVRIWEENPLLPVTGDLAASARQARFVSGEGHALEPGECLESEVAIPLQGPAPTTVAVRLQVVGMQRSLRRNWYLWTAFALCDPSLLPTTHVPLTSHAGEGREVH